MSPSSTDFKGIPPTYYHYLKKYRPSNFPEIKSIPPHVFQDFKSTPSLIPSFVFTNFSIIPPFSPCFDDYFLFPPQCENPCKSRGLYIGGKFLCLTQYELM